MILIQCYYLVSNFGFITTTYENYGHFYLIFKSLDKCQNFKPVNGLNLTLHLEINFVYFKSLLLLHLYKGSQV